MLERMLLYFALIYGTFRLPVRQYVFYIGKAKPAMPLALQLPGISYQYELINLQDFSYQTFLRTDSADEAVLAILGSFEKEEKAQVVEKFSINYVLSPVDHWTCNEGFVSWKYWPPYATYRIW